MIAPASPEWRPVVGFEGLYEVSSVGEVRSLRLGRIIARYKGHGGYMLVAVRRDAQSKVAKVHRLVAAAFIGTCPAGQQVNHIDGNKTNNHASNLEYVTGSQNIRHAVKAGLIPSGALHHKAKLTAQEVLEVRELYASRPSGRVPNRLSFAAIGRKYGVSLMAIRAVCLGLTHKVDPPHLPA